MGLTWMLTTPDSKIQSTGGRVSSENLFGLRKRRDFFGGLAMIFRHGQQLPRVKVRLVSFIAKVSLWIYESFQYTEEEIGTWSQIFRKLKVLHQRYACKWVKWVLHSIPPFIVHSCRQFLDNWSDLERYCGYRENNIPQLEDINR